MDWSIQSVSHRHHESCKLLFQPMHCQCYDNHHSIHDISARQEFNFKMDSTLDHQLDVVMVDKGSKDLPLTAGLTPKISNDSFLISLCDENAHVNDEDAFFS